MRASNLKFHVDSLTIYVSNNIMKRTIQYIKQKAYEFRWAFLSGILVGTTYIPFPPWALLFCYVPLWLYALKNDKSLKQIFLAGWITQFTLTMIGFHWIAHTAHEFGQMPWSISIAALLLFCAGMHIYIPLNLLLASWLRRKFSLGAASTLTLFALGHALFEQYWPAIFQWNLGYTLLWAKLPIYNFADVIGFEGLSTLVLLANAWLCNIWLVQHEYKRGMRHVVALALALVFLMVGGHYYGKKWNQFDGQLKASIIQANIGNLDKVYAEQGKMYQDSITKKFLEMSQQELQTRPDTELLIWPETAFPDYLDNHLTYRQYPKMVTDGVKNLKANLFTGAYSKGEQTARLREPSYNAVFLLNPEGINLSEPYRKTELLVFGEYLPLSEQFPILLEIFPFIANFGRGLGPMTMPLPLKDGSVVNLGPQICYEGLYPEFSRELSKKNAQILINVTNDSWFGQTFEPDQHLYMTLARGIETRRPLIRSTNTGISTAILANGAVLQKSPLHKEWTGQFTLKYLKNPPQTIYVEWGHFHWALSLFGYMILILGGARRARSRSS